MQYKISKPVRLVEEFSGYGATALALEYLGVDFVHWKTSEWQTDAIKAYHAIHMPDDTTNYSEEMSKEDLVDFMDKFGISTDGKKPLTRQQISRKGEKWLRDMYNSIKASHNVGSILNVHGEDLELYKDKDKYTTILTYSFPCTDLSLAGRQRGMERGSGTASSLLWETERILDELNERNELPEILLMENVPQVCGKKNLDNFTEWLSHLEELGYSNHYQILNAKDYTIPQNRQRCFCISILGDYEYEFPKPVELKKRLKDILEDEVDESYYINTEKAENLIGSLIDKGILPSQTDTYSLKNMGSSDEGRVSDREKSDVAHTIMARDWKGLNNYGSNGVIEKEQMGIDLTTNNPQNREVSNCLKAGARGITNFAQDETGVVEYGL